MKSRAKKKILAMFLINMMLVMVVAPSITNVMAKPSKTKLCEPDCICRNWLCYPLDRPKHRKCWDCRKEGCPLKPAKDINIFVDYTSGTYFIDEPVAGLEYNLYDGDDLLLVSGTTDSTGLIVYSITTSINVVGMHLDYTWHGVAESKTDITVGSNTLQLDSFEVHSELYWSDGVTPAEVSPVELWYLGVKIADISLSTLVTGQHKLNIGAGESFQGLIAGTYTLKGLFDDTTFIIPIDMLSKSYTTDILVSALGLNRGRVRNYPSFFIIIILHKR